MGDGRTYSLCDIQANDTLKRKQLEENPMLQQFRLVPAVEPQTAQNRNRGDDELEDRDPQMREVYTVGLSAVLADGERDNGADPDDDAGGYELENAVPDALGELAITVHV